MVEKIFVALGTSVAIIATIAVLVLLTFVVTTDGRIDYCYADLQLMAGHPPSFIIVGHVNWRADHILGIVNTQEEAVFWTNFLCPVKG